MHITHLLGTLCSSYIEILTNNVHSVRCALTKLPIWKLPAGGKMSITTIKLSVILRSQSLCNWPTFARTCLFPVQTGFCLCQKFFSMYAFVFILLHGTKCMSCSSILFVLHACPALQFSYLIYSLFFHLLLLSSPALSLSHISALYVLGCLSSMSACLSCLNMLPYGLTSTVMLFSFCLAV